MDIQENIDNLQKELDALKAKKAEEDKKASEIDYSVWRPDENQAYYVAYDPKVYWNCNTPTTIMHSRMYKSGLFATREHAETYEKIDKRYYEAREGVSFDWATTLKEFTTDELELWVLGGARL